MPLRSNGPPIGTPILIQDPQPVSIAYLGPQNVTQALDSGQARPLSLARGDFNQDGIEDLAVGYGAPDGVGIVALYTGNLDAFAPQSYESWLAIGRGEFPSPFLGNSTVFQIPKAPDFLARGNFSGSDHADLIAAARGDNTLYLLTGDGHGSFATPQAIPLPGVVTTLSAGRFGPGNLPSTMIVGIGGVKPALLLYTASSQGVALVGSYPLAASATLSFTDDMDQDGLVDVVVMAGGQISILHSVGAAGKPELETLSLGISAVGFTTGFFIHDRGWGRQIAVLDDAGAVHIVVHGGFDPRPWTKAEVKAMRDALLHRQPNPFARAESGPVRDGWKIIETLPGMASGNSAGPTVLLRSRISGGGTDDVLVVDPGAQQIALAVHPRASSAVGSFTPARMSKRIYPAGAPVAALSFPVNVDAREGLVVLHPGQAAPSVMMPIPGIRSVPTVQSAQEAR